ncbi:MAG TPA: quinone oxidoreductase [Longimicrobiales bacterium]|nr:quinone oxidoreductase [Longimicrobiales bacterium]
MDGAIVVSRLGGPEVLEWTRKDPGEPGPGEVLVRHTAVGLNFIDVYHRTGLYPLELPFTPGVEAAGVVERVGSGVEGHRAGDRVAYLLNGPLGSYCEARVLPSDRLFALPDDIDDETAAAIMLKGGTVEYLVRRTFPVKEDNWVLVHAAAGGVGLLLCQWLDALGANVIGTVGSAAKAELVRSNGCDHPIEYRHEDVAARVKQITDGRGVDVVYDSVGADTFEGSLNSLRPRGMMVSYGNASGPVEPVAPLLLAQKGSLFLTRPTIAHYYGSREESADGIAALFEVVSTGKVRPRVGARYPLARAAEAHRALEARETVGSTVLTV